MNICLLQTDPQAQRNNVQYLGWTINQVPADLYVLPELFTSGFDYIMQYGPVAAEVIPNGLTIIQIMKFLKGRSSAVVCGLLEQAGSDYYNIAAVIGDGWVERYRQKYPAFTVQGRALKAILPGDYQKIMLPSQWSMGLMICNDYHKAAEFFEEYKQRRVNAVVLIADSSNRTWLTTFPNYCAQYELPAIVCNAAGPNGGGSCIINSAGQFILLNTPQGQLQQLPDKPMAATGVL